MRALVFGAGGMLGLALVAAAEERQWPVQGAARAAVDVTDAGAVRAAVAAFAPDLVVNAAAFTQVDRCESAREVAFAVNAEGAAAVAAACATAGARLVHVSTDYVFDGTARRPIPEDASPAPLSVYGASKLSGERRVQASGAAALVVRTSALFGRGGPNFVDAIIRKLRAGERLEVVSDQVTAPTWTPFLARAILDLGESGATGAVHYRNREPLSWYDLARAVADEIGSAAVITPIGSAESVRPARRPAYSVLAVERYESIVGRAVELWRDGLRAHLAHHSEERE
jgi:dTDP-4-dehydrorhamnose reductase